MNDLRFWLDFTKISQKGSILYTPLRFQSYKEYKEMHYQYDEMNCRRVITCRNWKVYSSTSNEVTDTGVFLSISVGDNLIYESGQGVIATKNGSETASYTSIDIRNNTNYHGSAIYRTNSTGELSFLNNTLVYTRVRQMIVEILCLKNGIGGLNYLPG
jgi:hypothetical protein